MTFNSLIARRLLIIQTKLKTFVPFLSCLTLSYIYDDFKRLDIFFTKLKIFMSTTNILLVFRTKLSCFLPTKNTTDIS